MSLSKILLQTLAFLLVTAVCAVGVNAFHPSGVELTRNYFPKAQDGATGEDPAPSDAAGSEALDGPRMLDGFVVAETGYASDLAPFVEDIEEGGIFFLDARKKARFDEGHIPGAILLDHYQQSKYLTEELIRKLRGASRIIVYCKGGECEDSRFLARDLVFTHGVAQDVIQIYEGGFDAWTAAGHPVER